MIYDCRKEGRDPRARYFPCAVRVLCAVTGARIPNVFFLDTAPVGAAPAIGRFVTDHQGLPLVAPERKKRFVDDGRGGKKLEVYYDRFEVWERRPFVVVALKPDGTAGETIAKSEGAP